MQIENHDKWQHSNKWKHSAIQIYSPSLDSLSVNNTKSTNNNSKPNKPTKLRTEKNTWKKYKTVILVESN